MARADGRVQPGQRLDSAFSARAWNRAQDAADLVLGDRGGFAEAAAKGFDRAPNIAMIRNDTGQDVARFGVLTVSGVVVDPTTNDTAEASFAARPVLRGIRPTADLFGFERFVVCLEPIRTGQIGRGIVSGVFACKVYVNDVNHSFAVPRQNDTTQLQTATCGPVILFWKDIAGLPGGDPATRWAVGAM